MATTQVRISSAPGCRYPDPTEVRIVEGETVEFTTNADAATTLSLSPEAAALLLPAPAALQIPIPAGGSVSYQFAAAADGTYRVQVVPAGSPCPATMRGDASAGGAVLLVLNFGDADFSAPGIEIIP